MAAAGHDCRKCGAMWNDNVDGGECPECGSYSVTTFFDEFEPDPDFDELEEIQQAIQGGAA